MKYRMISPLVFATLLSACGNDFELSVPSKYAQYGIEVKDCKRDHGAASPVCTVRNGANIVIPENAFVYTCYDRQGNILYAPGGGRFPDRSLNPGTSVRHKFYCRNAEDLGKIELN